MFRYFSLDKYFVTRHYNEDKLINNITQKQSSVIRLRIKAKIQLKLSEYTRKNDKIWAKIDKNRYFAEFT